MGRPHTHRKKKIPHCTRQATRAFNTRAYIMLSLFGDMHISHIRGVVAEASILVHARGRENHTKSLFLPTRSKIRESLDFLPFFIKYVVASLTVATANG